MKFWSRAVTAAALAFVLSAVAASAATPPLPKPSKVNSLKATAGDQQVTLSWTSPTTGKPVTSYSVMTSPGGITTTDTSEPRTVSGLNNGTLYTFTVWANNSSGQGAKATVTATPKATPPSAPTNLGATPIGTGQIRLDWTPPTSNGSTPSGGNPPSITRYNITVSPGGKSAQVQDPTLTYTATGLADNVTYTFSVSATNSRSLTGTPAIVYAPLPSAATIGLQPTAGLLTTVITVTGELFLKNESLSLYWDVPTHPAGTLVTDDNGSFTRVLKPRALDKPGVHKLCANVQPKPCANFALQPKPTPVPSPSPVDSPTPSPIDSPQASAPRTNGGGGGGISGLDIITRPPFVFLPVIAILGLLGVLAFWALSGRRRRSPAPAAATVVHRATRPDYTTPFPPPRTPGGPGAPIPPAGAQPPIPGQPPVQPAWQAPVAPAPQPPAPLPPPVQPPPAAAPPAPPAAPPAPPAPHPAPPPGPVEWPAPPSWAGTPDEPPDLPQPSD